MQGNGAVGAAGWHCCLLPVRWQQVFRVAKECKQNKTVAQSGESAVPQQRVMASTAKSSYQNKSLGYSTTTHTDSHVHPSASASFLQESGIYTGTGEQSAWFTELFFMWLLRLWNHEILSFVLRISQKDTHMITVVFTDAFVGKKLTQPGKGSRRERSPCEVGAVGAARSLTEQAEGLDAVIYCHKFPMKTKGSTSSMCISWECGKSKCREGA